jgi:signal transduction histidine kinase
MDWHYHYTPYIWPMLASAVFMTALGIYAWRRRTVPGAISFVFLMGLWSLWAIGAALELAAVEFSTRVFWFKYQFFWSGPAIVAGLWFVLAYARLTRFLTRRNRLLLLMFIAVGSALILTNDAHHWMWLGFWSDGAIYPLRGSANWMLTILGFVLTLLNLPVLIWLFIRSPLHRWPVVCILCGQLVVRAGLLMDTANANPISPLDPTVLASNLLAVAYAIALFGFRIFDPLPVARELVITQMQEGMLVLDTRQRIAGMNPVAERILGLPEASLLRREVAEILPSTPPFPHFRGGEGGAETFQSEISLPEGRRDGVGSGSAARQYTLHLSPLKNRRGRVLGHLLLLSDITVQKQVQAQLVEKQRALAILSEREQLSRELHDSLGQVLGFTSLKMEAVRKLMADGKLAAADDQLAHLERIVVEAHADVREYILNLRAAPSDQQPFFSALQQYLDGFRQNYGIQADLSIGEGVDEGAFAPGAQMQVFRIIQEAFSNARKHAQTDCVKLSFDRQEERVRITVQDDGQGFDLSPLLPSLSGKGGIGHFGLRFMRERAEQLGGSLRVQSAPGMGTCVELEVPVASGQVFPTKQSPGI